MVWKLKQGVTWHDGKPFTADDVVFNWEYAKDPATAATTAASYNEVMVEKIDQYSVMVKFAKPTPFWADAFVGTRGMMIPKHLFADYTGGKSREAPTNLKPVGTGPYMFKDFKPGDLVAGVINPNYHEDNKPYFDAIEMKGGGDAVSAARAVLQSGEYDFAWNMQVEDEILARLEKGGKGKVIVSPGGNIEHIQLNFTDPWTEVDGERASLKTKHPTLSDPAVRQAISLLVDKDSIEKHIYGRTGPATANFVNNPARFVSKTTKFEFSVDKANEVLEKAGWKKGADGIREKDGKKLKFVYQTSINQPRQKTQAIVKQAAQKAGIDIELKSVTASVFFSSDVANPDTYTKFYCDLQMYTTTMSQPDPEVFMVQFASYEAATKENKWQGRNITRWQNKAYDDNYKAAQSEVDPVKRAAMFVEANNMVINDYVVIPVVARPASPPWVPSSTPRSAAGTTIPGTCPTGTRTRDQLNVAVPGLRPRNCILFRETSREPPVHHPPPADRHPEPARDQRHPVRHPRHGAGRSVRGAGHQPRHSARGSHGAARQVRPR